MGRHTTAEILDALSDAAVDEPPPLDMLLADVQNLQREKWDWILPDGLLRKAYASHYLDLDEALAWVLQAEFAKHRGISVQSLKQIEAGTANPHG